MIGGGGLLETPGCFHSCQTRSDEAYTDDDPAHPDVWTEAGHYQVRGEVEDYVADVE